MRIINLILSPGLIFLLASIRLQAQDADPIFNTNAVLAVENSLASDSMRGRAVFTPDIERAADYIETQFRAAGLRTWNGTDSYRQPFSMIRAKLLSISGTLEMAMFNIEMIGSPSKWGENSAFITGYERTDMAKILENNLAGSAFTFHPDPYPGQNLFYRSDNASLAKKGVPAHTISTTQIDIDKTYHTPEDEVSTPSRVDTSQLK
jgi:hypothetical protein